jgi:AraC family transcriptional regulator of adaptative response/methylated-DNA-[protein]-cysteine methyltransferase
MTQLLTRPNNQRVTSDEERWQAVLDRDGTHAAAFVYAVNTTGIYCRATCPSRRPRRTSVEFFERPREAEAAGYRACRRCHPDGDPGEAISLRRVRLAARAIHEDPSLRTSRLARIAGVSDRQLQREFRRLLGVTPGEYAAACRVAAFRARAAEGASVIDAAFEAGYGSLSRLYEHADELLGMTPRAYGRGAPGETIRYTVGTTADGELLIAATAHGICAIRIGDDADTLVAALHDEFADADIARDDVALEAWHDLVRRHVEGASRHLELPLDVTASAFQIAVWRTLRSIPRGKTWTYAEVARAVGNEDAARAVGRACRDNPVPLVIPCHRVVRADGELGGYVFGTGRKARFLAAEGVEELLPR